MNGWEIKPNGSNIDAVHRITGETFSGTYAAFNAKMASASVFYKDTLSRNVNVGDLNRVLGSDSAAHVVFTIPQDSAFLKAPAFGDTVRAVCVGTGSLSFAAANGVTLAGTPISSARYGSTEVQYVGANTWVAVNTMSGPSVLVDNSVGLVADQETAIQVKAGGPSYAELVIPATGQGAAVVRSVDGSVASIAAVCKLGGVRLANSGSSIVLPSVTLSAAADSAWTLGLLVRIEADNLQAGTAGKQFLKVGSGAAYFSLSYEGPNASNPRCIKVLMPNLAANGVTSGRTGTPVATSAFAAANIGQWVWLFIRKAGAAGSETALSASTGLPVTVTITDETLSTAWAPLQLDEPAAMTVSVASPVISAGVYSAATGALTVGADSSVTGTCDISKVFFLQQFVSAANLNKLATGKRPQDIGLTPADGTDIYYDLDSLTASQLLDLLGGTAATSVTMAGADALTPTVNMATTRKYIGAASATSSLEVMFADGAARGRAY